MTSYTAPSYSKIASGVIMRVGNYDTIAYPDRTQREVHPARRHESITYKIEEDLYGMRLDENGWEYYQYRFTYRYLGRTMSVIWRCGILYGEPKPIDGLEAAFSDARAVEYDDFGPYWVEEAGYDYETDYKQAEKVYKACERQAEKLTRFFASNEDRNAWESALAEQ